MGFLELFAGCCGARQKEPKTGETAPLLADSQRPEEHSTPSSPPPQRDPTQPSESEIALYAQTLRQAESTLTSLGKASGADLAASPSASNAASLSGTQTPDGASAGPSPLAQSKDLPADGSTDRLRSPAPPVKAGKKKKSKKSFKADAGW